MAKKHIIILGGSYAGVKAGKVLHKQFKKDPNVEITIIDRHPFHTLMTELHEVAGHRTEPDAIQVDLRKVFAGKKVNVVVDEINNIDFKAKKLSSERTTYQYDYLLLCTGNQSNFFGVEGAEEYAHTLWSYEDAVHVREHVEDMFRRASVEPDPEKRKALLTFAVCGGGFTGVEMAGELGEAKKHLAEQYMVDEKEVTIYNIEATGRILNMLDSDKQVKKIEDKYYRKLGINLLKNSPITKINKESIVINKNTEIPTHTLIWAAGIQNNDFAKNLGLKTGRGGRILVNEFMQVKGQAGLYAAGDNASYEDEDGVMPQIVQAAEQSGHTAAANVAAEIKGTELHKHKQKYNGFMVSVGSRRAVADTGFKSSGWFAMLIKHVVNFLYLFLVSGVRQLWNYLMHEFFHIKNRRSFVGGHFSKASPNFWKVPLRIWLGYMWLVEGLKKINEGWLDEVKIISTPVTDAATWGTAGEAATAVADATASASQAATTVVEATASASQAATAVVEATASASQAATAVVDATASASQAVDTVVETAHQLPAIFQWVVNHMPSGWGQPLLAETPDAMNWFMETFMGPIAIPVQTIMIFTEIIIGICLIFGLFTFISSGISVIMTIGITLTGMSDATIIWYFVGGIALLGGSGSTFGLDYYVLPYLKRWWKKTSFARKTHLYFD
ncbi:FAD-dependent oxidoreductase [Vallitalea okinawensis]|uniref:FAD-dependent oxidoreductase n=1 Tax=Vallitalea okinawensis TaxID=2078660 RepID=UPI000CFB9BEA|nr:FAD-dependent oxidoreductase [Vallitalea okinawensis]